MTTGLSGWQTRSRQLLRASRTLMAIEGRRRRKVGDAAYDNQAYTNLEPTEIVTPAPPRSRMRWPARQAGTPLTPETLQPCQRKGTIRFASHRLVKEVAEGRIGEPEVATHVSDSIRSGPTAQGDVKKKAGDWLSGWPRSHWALELTCTLYHPPAIASLDDPRSSEIRSE